MFYVTSLTTEIVLAPRFFGSTLHSTITRLVKESVEGTALAHYGYVVSVLDVPREKMKGGVIEYDSGDVVFSITYEALLFRPFKNEVLDAVVVDVTNMGFFAYVGPLRIFVHSKQFPPDLNGTTGGHFTGSSWVSDDGEVHIKDNSGVRLRIIGTKVDAGDISCIGCIATDFLGVIDNGEGGEGMME
jgi:DNA-directed RNA polymerase II subunit RPB7